ncbi:hypothetical protein FACS1894200_03230 [Spirochaetia bacterium]|nr:hypothetical protein FACS1894200_03230 [Spirochaetia bacterium]
MQAQAQINAPDILRGEVQIYRESTNGFFNTDNELLDVRSTQMRALEETAAYFSAMIYGWSFSYDIGERSRGIEEVLDLESLGSISFGDSGLAITDTKIENMIFSLSSDYHLSSAQQRRMALWKSGTMRNIQGVGEVFIDNAPAKDDWLAIKRMAIVDAARQGLRALLQSTERNRPRQAYGLISLSRFPHFWMKGGRWMAAAQFKVEVKELVPFAAY